MHYLALALALFTGAEALALELTCYDVATHRSRPPGQPVPVTLAATVVPGTSGTKISHVRYSGAHPEILVAGPVIGVPARPTAEVDGYLFSLGNGIHLYLPQGYHTTIYIFRGQIYGADGRTRHPYGMHCKSG
ncbi:MAG: hypothetical protein HUU37_09010 [Bdellovibrionales bacterium]|nr:hypothetical protein [Bdellovibrionales bacterium]